MPNPSTLAHDDQPAIQSWSRPNGTGTAVPRTCSAIYEVLAPIDPLFTPDGEIRRLYVVTFQAVDQTDALEWLIANGYTSNGRSVVAIFGCSIGDDCLAVTHEAIETRRARWEERARQWDRNVAAGRQCWDDGGE